MTLAYVGIGSNLERPREQVLQAFEELDRIPATRLVRRSSLYRTAPVGHADQADFINAVAELDSALPPRELLGQLMRIEAGHGRARSFPNAPRTLDLDLLAVGAQVVSEPGLVLPHPRMFDRAFVLKPLLEIDPGFPGAAEALENRCAGQRAERIA